jgi:hypothetical protein
MPPYTHMIPCNSNSRLDNKNCSSINRACSSEGSMRACECCGIKNIYVILARKGKGFHAEISIKIGLETSDQHKITATALIDSRCTQSAINKKFVHEYSLPYEILLFPMCVFNADGTENKNGTIRKSTKLLVDFDRYKTEQTFFVTDLAKDEIFLGYDWLHKHNLEIDWTNGMVRLSDKEINRKVAGLELVPEAFHEYASVFLKDGFDNLPEQKPWDHEIHLLPNAPDVIQTKTYPLTPAQQDELDAFLKENLATGRIRPSKSPYAAPVFFIGKKDGGFHMIQDYHELNKVTVKDQYPLPRISELFEIAAQGNYFCKFDVRWGYNNIRIKPGHEWKAAFQTTWGLYEPLVMFFEQCNSPPTFQKCQATNRQTQNYYLDHAFHAHIMFRASELGALQDTSSARPSSTAPLVPHIVGLCLYGHASSKQPPG